MKSIKLIALLSVSASLSFGGNQLDVKVPDTVEHDLVGNVKSVTETENKQILVGSKKSSTSFDVRTYDPKGNRLLKEEKDQDGNVTERIEYKYNDSGCFFEEIVEDLEKHTIEQFKITIDSSKRVIIKENIKTKEKKATLYSKAGFEMKIKELDGAGEVTKSSEFKRLANHKEYRLTFFDADGKKTTTVSLEWNRDGTAKKTKIQNHKKNYVFTSKYEYKKKDSTGNWLERVEHASLTEKGKTSDFSTKTVTREIEYH